MPAGEGIVAWRAVFGELRRTGYDGYLLIHCEYDIDEGADWHGTFVREVTFFQRMPRGVRSEGRGVRASYAPRRLGKEAQADDQES